MLKGIKKMNKDKENFPEKGPLVDRDTGIEIKEFYNGNSSSIWKAYRGNDCIAKAKDRVSLVRLLNKTFG